MKLKVVLDTSALDAIQAGLSVVASGDTGRAIMREIAADYDARVKAAYDAGRDPYGVAWKPTARGNRVGFRTGTQRGTLAVRAYGNRILLTTGVPYSGYFVRGTPRQVPRPIFPEASIGLPPAWKEAAAKIVRRHTRKAMGRR